MYCIGLDGELAHQLVRAARETLQISQCHSLFYMTILHLRLTRRRHYLSDKNVYMGCIDSKVGFIKKLPIRECFC
jgi:hypothetical protein